MPFSDRLCLYVNVRTSFCASSLFQIGLVFSRYLLWHGRTVIWLGQSIQTPNLILLSFCFLCASRYSLDRKSGDNDWIPVCNDHILLGWGLCFFVLLLFQQPISYLKDSILGRQWYVKQGENKRRSSLLPAVLLLPLPLLFVFLLFCAYSCSCWLLFLPLLLFSCFCPLSFLHCAWLRQTPPPPPPPQFHPQANEERDNIGTLPFLSFFCVVVIVVIVALLVALLQFAPLEQRARMFPSAATTTCTTRRGSCIVNSLSLFLPSLVLVGCRCCFLFFVSPFLLSSAVHAVEAAAQYLAWPVQLKQVQADWHIDDVLFMFFYSSSGLCLLFHFSSDEVPVAPSVILLSHSWDWASSL